MTEHNHFGEVLASDCPACRPVWLERRVEQLETENKRLEEELSSSDECLIMVAERLQAYGCKCGPTAHKATPPMCYDDWITCVVNSKTEALRAEVERLKAGHFTVEEVQDLCHGLQECDVGRFRRGFEEYQEKLFGFTKHARGLRTPEWTEKASKRYEGQTEPCCECGKDYPRADLALLGKIYCAACREAEARRKI